MKTTNTTLLDALKTINTVTEDYSVAIYVEDVHTAVHNAHIATRASA